MVEVKSLMLNLSALGMSEAEAIENFKNAVRKAFRDSGVTADRDEL